ncbi:alpha/beta hydrolase family protein [Chitinimonas naiadis]
MDATRLTLTAADGICLQASLYRATRPRRGVVILNSAAGVKRRFYDDFARDLAHTGFDVLSWDARGIGDSALQPARLDPARMADWGRYDLEGVIRHVLDAIGPDGRRVVVIGHSAGGNLSGLAPSLSQVGGLCLIASGTCYWRLYPKQQWLRMLFAWHVAMPLLLRSFGYLPARFGVGHHLPAGIARDWRNWSLQADYLFSDTSLDVSGYARFRGPLLAIGMADDHGFAPPRTVANLLQQFSAARIDHRTLSPKAMGLRQIGHFNFFRRQNAVLWAPVRDWLLSTLPVDRKVGAIHRATIE